MGTQSPVDSGICICICSLHVPPTLRSCCCFPFLVSAWRASPLWLVIVQTQWLQATVCRHESESGISRLRDCWFVDLLSFSCLVWCSIFTERAWAKVHEAPSLHIDMSQVVYTMHIWRDAGQCYKSNYHILNVIVVVIDFCACYETNMFPVFCCC